MALSETIFKENKEKPLSKLPVIIPIISFYSKPISLQVLTSQLLDTLLKNIFFSKISIMT
jgi:hypothetical protein